MEEIYCGTMRVVIFCSRESCLVHWKILYGKCRFKVSTRIERRMQFFDVFFGTNVTGRIR